MCVNQCRSPDQHTHVHAETGVKEELFLFQLSVQLDCRWQVSALLSACCCRRRHFGRSFIIRRLSSHFKVLGVCAPLSAGL